MKYLLTLFGDETRFADRTPEQQAESMKAWDAYTSAAIDAGVHLGGEGLQPSSTATTVQIRESGDRIVSDGPFAETKEQLGGYYLLDCKDLDDALAWAKRIPMPGGTVEVRPVMDYEAIGSELHTNEAKAEARS
ncbi:MAG: YciI family protein [Thermoleophilaceae bacterium]